MLLDEYYSFKNGCIHISPEQASRFAKRIAGDYNPIHNPGARRFCVPGDLLFALVISFFGLSQRMNFRFLNMVGAGVELEFGESSDGSIQVCDANKKTYLRVERQGETTYDEALLEEFIRCYVEDSGNNFPCYLKPVMKKHGVMFNPRRPLVIYDSMSFYLKALDALSPSLSLFRSSLNITGQRGSAKLLFRLYDGSSCIGSSSKKLIICGLRSYDEIAMDKVIAEFNYFKMIEGFHQLE